VRNATTGTQSVETVVQALARSSMGTRVQFGALCAILNVETVSSTLPTKLRRESGEPKHATSATRERLLQEKTQTRVTTTKMHAAAHVKSEVRNIGTAKSTRQQKKVLATTFVATAGSTCQVNLLRRATLVAQVT